MTSEAKVIELIIYDDNSSGIIKLQNTDWKGICYKIPRNRLKELKSQLVYPGVYILIGMDNDKPVYYIGESDDVNERLTHHNSDPQKDYWNTALAFLGIDTQPLDKAMVKYLESRMYDIAKNNAKSGRFIFKNKKESDETVLSETQLIKANKYLRELRVIVGVLGYNVLNEVPFEQHKVDDADLFYIVKPGKTIDAKGCMVDKGFKVFAGSICATEMTAATTANFKVFNQKLRDDKIIVNNRFSVDYTFSTPSAAATQVLGHNANGLTEWKSAGGITLKEILGNL